MTILWIAVAGVAGVLVRYGADVLAVRFAYPPALATGAVNLVGCFAVGAVYVLSIERGALSPSISGALMVGFCGGLTTFSAYSLQAVLMTERGEIGWSLAYLFGSPILGAFGVMAGLATMRSLT